MSNLQCRLALLGIYNLKITPVIQSERQQYSSENYNYQNGTVRMGKETADYTNDELLKVKGIGDKTLENIRSQVKLKPDS